MPHPEITTDTHDTKEQAEGVCKLLNQYGFGGNCRLFPVETWIDPVSEVTI
jgi:hypothetical protein